MAPVDQCGKLDPARSTQVQQSIEGSPDRSPCEEGVINQKDMLIFDWKMNLGLLDFRRLTQPGPITAVECDINNSCGKTDPSLLKNLLFQPLRQKNPSCPDSNQDHLVQLRMSAE